MSGLPNFEPEWASDDDFNDPGTDWDGFETKTVPGSTEKSQGLVPANPIAANHVNYMFHALGRVAGFLRALPANVWANETAHTSAQGAAALANYPLATDRISPFWCVVGDADDVFISTSGRTWIDISPALNNLDLRFACESEDGFVIVCGGTENRGYKRMYSAPTSWTAITPFAAGSGCGGIVFEPGSGKWVAVGGTGAGAFVVRTSAGSDGSTWTSQTVPSNPSSGVRTRENAIGVGMPDGAGDETVLILHNPCGVADSYVLYSSQGDPTTWQYSGQTGPVTGESNTADKDKWSHTNPIWCAELGKWFLWIYNTTDSKSKFCSSTDGLTWTTVLSKDDWVVDSVACRGALLLSSRRALNSNDGAILISSVDGGVTWQATNYQFPTTAGGSVTKLYAGLGQFFALDTDTDTSVISAPTGDQPALT